MFDNQKRNIEDRQASTKDIQTGILKQFPLTGRLRLHVFNVLLHYTHRFTILRENQRHLWHKILRVSRYSALRIGKEFVDAGIIIEQNDVFYLTWANVIKLLEKRCSLPNAKELVAIRKKQISGYSRKH